MIDVLNRKTFRAHVHTSGRSHVRLTDYIVASWPAENFRAFIMFAFEEEARVSVPSPDASFKLFSGITRLYSLPRKRLVIEPKENTWNNSLIVDTSQLKLITQCKNPECNNANKIEERI